MVVPDLPTLPNYGQAGSIAMAALITAATGAPPERIADAWVRRYIGDDHPTSFPDGARRSERTAGSSDSGVIVVARVSAVCPQVSGSLMRPQCPPPLPTDRILCRSSDGGEPAA